MNDYMKEALGLVRAQASVRPMNEEELIAMVSSLAKKLAALEAGAVEDEETVDEASSAPIIDPKKSIKERSITCLECGKVMKVITAKHLATHGLDAKSYCEKYGFKKGTPLSCKSLVKMRRQKMADMRLWEKRKAARETEDKK